MPIILSLLYVSKCRGIHLLIVNGSVSYRLMIELSCIRHKHRTRYEYEAFLMVINSVGCDERESEIEPQIHRNLGLIRCIIPFPRGLLNLCSVFSFFLDFAVVLYLKIYWFEWFKFCTADVIAREDFFSMRWIIVRNGLEVIKTYWLRISSCLILVEEWIVRTL